VGIAALAAPPYRIETERLVLRCWQPRDAPLLKEAIDASVEHLRPWMEWVPDEPEELGVFVERLRRFRAEFDRDESWVMGVFAPDESRVLGGTGLHRRVGPGGLEIGYWIRADATRQGYAMELAAALTRIGIEHCGADRVELRIEPTNEASLGVPAKLGFREEGTLRRRLAPLRGGEPRDVTVFTLFASELAASSCASAAYRGFDAAGQPSAPRPCA
jgi:RimJ/RimL family protein N-acetyltransferase